MKIRALVVMVALLALSSAPASAGLSDMMEIKKAFGRAATYIKQDNNSAAASEYRAILIIQPDNFKANWKLGEYYLNGDVDTAERYFKNAILEKPSKKDEVSKLFYQAGISAFDKGKFDKADRYAKAISTFGSSSSLRSEYVSRAIAIAKANITTGNITHGKVMINFAKKYGYSNTSAAAMVYVIGDNVEQNQKMVDIYTYAHKLSSAKNKASRYAGVRIAKYARSIENHMKYSGNINDMIEQASDMTVKEDGIEPYTVTLEPGQHGFHYKKGDRGSHWIKTPSGLRVNCEFFSDNRKYMIVYSNENVVRLWKREQAPRINNASAFKFVPIDDTFVGLEITANP